MSYDNETTISIYKKDGPSYYLFTKILDNIDVLSIKIAYINPCYDEKQFHAIFRKSFGFELYNNPPLKIPEPSKKQVADLTKKLWAGLRGIELYLTDDLFIRANANNNEDYEYEASSAEARRITRLGLQKSKNILHVNIRSVPEQISNESIDIVKNVIKVFRPSNHYFADLSVERCAEPKSKILTLEELSA